MSSRSRTTENRKKKKKAKAQAAGIGNKPNVQDDDDGQEDDQKHQQTKEQAKKWLAELGVSDILKSSLFTADAPIESMKQQFRTAKPFPYLSITDFADAEFLEQLKHELMDMDYNKKSNDLYEFAQSDDLASFSETTHPLIAKFKNTLYSKEFRALLSNISGIELNDTIDMSANVYSDTHTLLCHDDELSGRRLAYIVYLVPQDWSASDGGTLDLFNVDSHLQPSDIAHSHVPQWNSFIFFEVSPVSYHQVREVLVDKHRLSISGWFHGTNIVRPTPYIEPSTIMHEFQKGSIVDDWVGREYRKPAVIKQVNKQFLKESSIELHNFLRKDKYDELLKEMSAVTSWKQRGPANKRRYDVIDTTSTDESKQPTTPLIHSLHQLLLSTEFAALITEMTGVELTGGACEVRRFQSGDYTLAHDDDEEMKQCGLDAQLVIIPSRAKWTTTMGGSVHYLAEGQDEELLSVFPRSNCLSLVYRSAGGVMRFVKYLNHYAASARYDFMTVYRVVEDDDDGDDDDDEEMESEEEPEPAPPAKKSKSKATK